MKKSERAANFDQQVLRHLLSRDGSVVPSKTTIFSAAVIVKIGYNNTAAAWETVVF